jgi:hypothetical protein
MTLPRLVWKWTLWTIAVVALLLLLAAGLFLNKVGLDNAGLMYRLRSAEGAILPMNGDGEYVSKAKGHRELLKKKMHEEGWTYAGQEGSGYFFEKDGETTIVTATQIWNRHYIKYRTANREIDLAAES